MALSLGAVKPLGKRIKKDVILDVTFDASYADGGESLTASDLGLNTVLSVHATGTDGYAFAYDYTNAKLLAFYGYANAADAVAVQPVGVDLSAVVARVHAVGY